MSSGITVRTRSDWPLGAPLPLHGLSCDFEVRLEPAAAEAGTGLQPALPATPSMASLRHSLSPTSSREDARFYLAPRHAGPPLIWSVLSCTAASRALTRSACPRKTVIIFAETAWRSLGSAERSGSPARKSASRRAVRSVHSSNPNWFCSAALRTDQSAVLSLPSLA